MVKDKIIRMFKRRRSNLKRYSGNKLHISRAELKHTSTNIFITLYAIKLGVCYTTRLSITPTIYPWYLKCSMIYILLRMRNLLENFIMTPDRYKKHVHEI